MKDNTDLHYYQGVRELLNTLAKVCGKCVCDIGLLNEIGILTNERLARAQSEN